MIYIFVCSALLLSCDKTKMAANWESEILTFELPEYPDAEIKIDGTLILIHMPEEVADLNMKMEYTMSSGATGDPESGTEQDFGFPVGIGVTSEDGLYFTTYHATVVYPSNKLDFNSISLPAQSERYGQDFALSYAGFKSAATASGMMKWDGFAMSSRSGADLSNPPADVSPWQFYPGEDSGLGSNVLLVRPGYGAENAVEITFSRPIDPDTLTIVPSALTLHCMKNGYTDESNQVHAAMNSQDGDYMMLVLEGYDADDNLLGTKEQYIADFRYAERAYIRENWQTMKLKATRLKEIKKMKFYVKGAREDFYPVFAIDKMTYQVQPQLTPSEDDDE